ncbi:MAG: D-alanyl-D-alanine carboxypeptidase/D-alanyl-D-alanine-endopeptidase [Halobacteriovoraceae bacterium]|nr:D-alanyl-D-alanine carboxypeptidase/D-alanyl-D-alanine-endopeptidase [Halobacteriovoraceae bacterium]
MKYFLLSLVLISVIYASEFTQGVDKLEKDIFEKYKFQENQISFTFKEISSLEEQKLNHREFNQTRPFIPASVAKVFSTFYALKTLGPDFRFQTILRSNGIVKEGVLQGDLHLRGTGDPSLNNSHLFNLVLQLKSLGITKIAGKFYYDDSHFAYLEKISDLGLGDQTYNPGLSALSSEYNRVKIWRYGNYRTTWKDKFIEIPDLDTFSVENSKDKFHLGKRFKLAEVNENKEIWLISNHLRYNTVEEIPIRNPALWTASLFKLMAQREGIDLPLIEKLPSPVPNPLAYKTLALNQSAPLIQLVKLTHEYSNNLFAEAIVVAAHLHRGKQITTIEQSANELLIALKELFPKLDWSSFSFKNASGLSSNSKVSTDLIASFLKNIVSEKFGNHFFRSTLSISGQSGWLIRRLNTPDLSHRVWAKTGAIDYVSSLAGYFYAKSGKLYSFALIVNDFEKRNKSDNGDEKEIYSLKNSALKWRHRSHDFMDDLLTHWINRY